MIFEITRLRDRGRVLPRYQTSFRRTGPLKIVISDYFDDVGQRHMRRALALDPASGRAADDTPALLDATVIRMESDYMIITGFERITDELGKQIFDFQQTWYALHCKI